MSSTTYHHLTLEERWQIKALWTRGLSRAEIARQLGRSRNTIAVELKRGGLPEGDYCPKRAQRRYDCSKRVSGNHRRKLSGALWDDMRRCLHQRWSPEQIVGRRKQQGQETVAVSTVYRAIHRTKNNKGLLACLRHGGKPYKRGKAGKSLIPNRTDIAERPAIVEEKARMGDWEADTIIGAAHQGCIISLVDRASKYTKLATASTKETRPVCKQITRVLKPFKELTHSITYDNGGEFAHHEHVNEQLGCQSFFATPYHSWERGLNEHTNGLIRQFFPKGTPLNHICKPPYTTLTLTLMLLKM